MEKNLNSANRENITLLMANHNNGMYIQQSVDSIIGQTSPLWKLIIADDQSTDNSREIYKKYERFPRIKILFNHQNLGYIKTLKKLIDLADTDIVGIIDPDDKLGKNCVEMVLDYYRRGPETGFLYTNFWYCDENLNIEKKGYCRAIPEGKTALKCDLVSHFKTFRKSVYQKTAGLDESILYAEDKDLVLKMEEVTKLHFLDQELYYYRVKLNSQSHGDKRKISKRSYARAKRRARWRRIKTKINRLLKLSDNEIQMEKEKY
ncbi:MAG: hypothetical protein APR63_11395 [Desulfuromonas sp. SDB]|nr:MAG: hypothetical protein APR63_11395 [Desulfuromonas sp. SDB]